MSRGKKNQTSIENENFNFWFANLAAEMTEVEQLRVPPIFLEKLFRMNGKFNVTSDKMKFLDKLYILHRALRKKIFVVIEDESGIGVEDFLRLNKEWKPETYEDTDRKIDVCFVLSNKELADGFSAMNHRDVSPAYNYFLKSKNTAPSQIAHFNRQMSYLGKTVAWYEGRKRKMMAEYGLTLQQWYILTYICDGKDYEFKNLYEDVFAYGIGSTQPMMYTGLTALRKKGLVERFGETHNSKIRITARGKDFTQTILHKYFANW